MRQSLSILLIALMFFSISAQANERLDALRAAYVYYLMKFVSWPDSKKATSICILSESDSIRTQFQSLEAKGQGDLTIEFDPLRNAFEACQLVYIGTMFTQPATELKTYLDRPGILVVSEAVYDFTTVRFFIGDNKLQFDINQSLGARHGLKFSSKLLNLAARVY